MVHPAYRAQEQSGYGREASSLRREGAIIHAVSDTLPEIRYHAASRKGSFLPTCYSRCPAVWAREYLHTNA